MLAQLSIRDVVLIDRLDLGFEPGLCALTGETGAGKSILLDALGLALGERADSALVRPSAGQASVTAVFEAPGTDAAAALLADQGLAGDGGEALVLRRVLSADGRSRAFVNDQPVSATLLRQVGQALVEIQGQFEQLRLRDPAVHRDLLDAYAGLDTGPVAAAWRAAQDAERVQAEAVAAAARAADDADFLRHALDELGRLDPQPDEETALAEQRQFLLHATQLAEAMQAALQALDGEAGAAASLAQARRALDRVADKAGGLLGPACGALDRAAAEIDEAQRALSALEADADPGRLQAIDDRLFALRDLARKHRVAPDALPALRQDLAARLAAIDDGDRHLADLAASAATARRAYLETADAVSQARQQAAVALDTAIAGELPPLKLDRASFHTRIERLPEGEFGPRGVDRVAFHVATNPGMPLGPISRVASGGELSRLLLALKVVLAQADPVPTLVFDEVDAQIGGATAAAVGERLARLAREVQVLVVTHSPQVAARAAHHWQVRKKADSDAASTAVTKLSATARREEIARMLSGARVTKEARAAAERLIATAHG